MLGGFILLFVYFHVFSQSYFQQKVSYTINVKLDTAQKILKGHLKVVYYNNSPDTLKFIYFHLWPNAYRNSKTPLAKDLANNGNGKLKFQSKKHCGYIDSIDFSTGGKKLSFKYTIKSREICKVFLLNPLKSGDSVIIETPFRVKLPPLISRSGYKDGFYSITQWYPKPAVYDRFGWHIMPYLEKGEFYSEFGKYDVFITVPKNLIVAATGKLQTPEELQWLMKIALFNSEESKPIHWSENDYKTLHYSDSLIHDFAWFASEKFSVAYDSIITPKSQKKVNIWFFSLQSLYYHNEWAISYVRKAVEEYSKIIGDYPYENCTVVSTDVKSGVGMEYPQIAIVSSNTLDLAEVIYHEVAHNWFYGILGFNERQYPFLDEGFTTYYTNRVLKKLYSDTKILDNVMTYFGFNKPLNLPATNYSSFEYAITVYQKTAFLVNMLEKFVGTQEFDSLMQCFYEKWKFKHPYPEDLEEFFKQSLDNTVSWFFDGYVKTKGYSDATIKVIKNSLIVKNKGNIYAPVLLKTIDKDKDTNLFWLYQPQRKYKITIDSLATEFFVDPDRLTLDFNVYNNYYNKTKLIKKYNDFKFILLPINYKPNNLNFYIFPVILYSNERQLRLGVLLSNYAIPFKNFNFFTINLYNFQNKGIENYISAEYLIPAQSYYPTVIFRFIYDSYAYPINNRFILPTFFRKIKFNLEFNNKSIYNPNLESKLLFSWYLVLTDAINFDFYKDVRNKYTFVYTINYSLAKNSIYKPWRLNTACHLMSNNNFFAFIDFSNHFHYLSLFDGLNIRYFIGMNVPLNSLNGLNDYLYDNFFFNRYSANTYENLFTNQIYEYFGGFIMPNDFKINDLVFSINLKTTLPKIPVLNFYFNAAKTAMLVDGRGLKQLDFSSFLYEYGIMFDLFSIIKIYIPISGSDEIVSYSRARNLRFIDLMSFSINYNFDYSKLNAF